MKQPVGPIRARSGFGQVVRSAPDMPDQVARARGPMVSLAVGAGALGGAAWLILAGHRLLAGVAALAGAVATLGPTGDRATARRPRLTLAGRLLDRAFEGAILAPLAWVARQGSVRVSVLALVGLGASYLASYERARGESLGYREAEGPGFRTVRAGLLVLALLTGWVEFWLWAFTDPTFTLSRCTTWTNRVAAKCRASCWAVPSAGRSSPTSTVRTTASTAISSVA